MLGYSMLCCIFFTAQHSLISTIKTHLLLITKSFGACPLLVFYSIRLAMLSVFFLASLVSVTASTPQKVLHYRIGLTSLISFSLASRSHNCFSFFADSWLIIKYVDNISRKCVFHVIWYSFQALHAKYDLSSSSTSSNLVYKKEKDTAYFLSSFLCHTFQCLAFQNKLIFIPILCFF